MAKAKVVDTKGYWVSFSGDFGRSEVIVLDEVSAADWRYMDDLDADARYTYANHLADGGNYQSFEKEYF